MAGLHPIESGALFQEGHPQSESDSFVSSTTSRGCEPAPAPNSGHDHANLSRKPPDYVISDRQMRRLFSQYERLGKRLRIVHDIAYRQPHCPHAGEIRSFYLAPQQVKLEAACRREHGAANVVALLARCIDLLVSRSQRQADPVLDLVLATLRDARFLCAQMRLLLPEDTQSAPQNDPLHISGADPERVQNLRG